MPLPLPSLAVTPWPPPPPAASRAPPCSAAARWPSTWQVGQLGGAVQVPSQCNAACRAKWPLHRRPTGASFPPPPGALLSLEAGPSFVQDLDTALKATASTLPACAIPSQLSG